MPVLDLGDDPSDVPRARRWVLGRCADEGLGDEQQFAVELVTSELVANAYQHGRPPVRVEVRLGLAAVGGAGDGTGLRAVRRRRAPRPSSCG